MVGEPGAGKTELLRQCLQQLGPRFLILLQGEAAAAVDREILCLSMFVEPRQVAQFTDLTRFAELLSSADKDEAMIVEVAAGADVFESTQKLAWLIEASGTCYVNGIVGVQRRYAGRYAESMRETAWFDMANKVFQGEWGPGSASPVWTVSPRTACRRADIGNALPTSREDFEFFLGSRAEGSTDVPRWAGDRRPPPTLQRLQARSYSSELPFDAIKVSVLFSCLSRTYGPAIHRAKGVMNLAGQDRKIIVQSMDGKFGCKTGEHWKAGEVRRSSIVVWGENLIWKRFVNGFDSCLLAYALH